MTVSIQYVGFKSKATVREYRFLLRESSIAPHEIISTILNEAFRSHGLRYLHIRLQPGNNASDAGCNTPLCFPHCRP
jgi:hypothetical protein